MQVTSHHSTSVQVAKRQFENYTEDYPKRRAPHVLECNPDVGEYTPHPLTHKELGYFESGALSPTEYGALRNSLSPLVRALLPHEY